MSVNSGQTNASSVPEGNTYSNVKRTRMEDREDVLIIKNGRRRSTKEDSAGDDEECGSTASAGEISSHDQKVIQLDEESSTKMSEESSQEALQKLVEETKFKTTKHIRPCICDLPKRRRATIEQFLKEKRVAQQKFQHRVWEIEEQIRLAEEREADRLRELEAEKEFYGDEYEIEGKKKKRKKRSARRASMVSLGVKQVISWRKPPRIRVRYTRTSEMRAHSSTYCKPPFPPLHEIPVKPLYINLEGPAIPVRATRTVELRAYRVQQLIASLKMQEIKVKYPKRPPFVTKLW